MTIIRWICVLPISIIVFTILFFLGQLIGGFIPLYNELPWLLYFVISAASYGGAVVAGTLTAPKYDRQVAFVLCLLLIFLNGFTLYGVLGDKEYYGIIEVIGGVFGSVFAYKTIIDEDLKEE